MVTSSRIGWAHTKIIPTYHIINRNISVHTYISDGLMVNLYIYLQLS